MSPWIVVAVVVVVIALGYVLTSMRTRKQEEQRLRGVAGEHLDTKLDPHPDAPRED